MSAAATRWRWKYGKRVHMFYGHPFSILNTQCIMTFSQWQTLKASNSETRAATANLRPDLESSFQALQAHIMEKGCTCLMGTRFPYYGKLVTCFMGTHFPY
jgi:hypothetical protein